MKHVGIDLHKLESQICVVGDEGPIAELRVRTDRERLQKALVPYAGASVLIEAATESEWVAQWLEQLGHNVIVADPNYAPMYAYRSRRVKTDRRDARTLAEACRLGAYRPAHRVSAEQRHVRRLLTSRETLVRARTRAIAVMRAMIRQDGLRVRSGMAETFSRRVAELALGQPLATVLQPLLEVSDHLTAQIGTYDHALSHLACADPVVERLRSVPGVGPVTALAFVSTVDDVERFASAHQLEAFLGLTPSERSSGEQQRRGRVSKTGDSRARTLLVEAAWRVLISRRPELDHLRQWALRIAARRGRRIAVVALARRLAGILYALWRDGSTYRGPVTVQ